jgi:putative solute:sodium symporter small subunit
MHAAAASLPVALIHTGSFHMAEISPDKAKAHWAKTSALMWTVLAVWFIFSFAIHFIAPALNKIVIFGFPLGFYMAAQGSLIVFVVVLFWYAHRQNRIDEEFDVAED